MPRAPSQDHYWTGSINTSSTNPAITERFTMNTEAEVISGSSLPNWRELIASGRNASTNYSRTSIQQRHAYFDHRGRTIYDPPGKWQRQQAYWNAGLPRTLSPASDSALQDIALARLKRKLADDTGHFEALVPLAEIGELRGLVRATATSAITMTRGLLEIKQGRFKDAAKRASDLWLTWSFGISPTINDTQAAIDAVAAYYDKSKSGVRYKHYSGTASKRWKETFSAVGTQTINQVSISSRASLYHNLSYRYIAGILPAVKGSLNYGANEQFGFDFKALPSVGWELVPFSWVADYFGTMGAYLEDTFTANSGTTVYCVLCKKYEAHGISQISGPQPSAYAVMLGASQRNGFLRYRHFSRTSVGSLPHRALRFKTVDEIGLNSVNKLLNLASILVR